MLIVLPLFSSLLPPPSSPRPTIRQSQGVKLQSHCALPGWNLAFCDHRHRVHHEDNGPVIGRCLQVRWLLPPATCRVKVSAAVKAAGNARGPGSSPSPSREKLIGRCPVTEYRLDSECKSAKLRAALRQDQVWANYGPRAMCGPFSFLMFPSEIKEIIFNSKGVIQWLCYISHNIFSTPMRCSGPPVNL